VYFKVRGSNIHETIIDIISRILEASGGRWASDWSLGDCVFSDMRSFSKIHFPDSLTVGLCSNFGIWFITCYFMV